MKKLIVALVTVNFMILITGCTTGCKIDGCGNKLYKNGLCEEHYNVIEKASEQTTMIEESIGESKIEEIKAEETTIQQEEQRILSPFSENTENEISEGISPDDYVLPECSIRVYSREELSTLSAEELRLARNEVYARYGRVFSADDLNTYFSSKSWYIPRYSAAEFDAKGDSILNQFEIENRNLIIQLEGEGQNVSTSQKIDYKGNYNLKGDEFIWVKNYYISNNTLYVEGEYCDGINNPHADNEGDTLLFYTIKDTVTVRIDNQTEFQWEGIDNIRDLKSHIDRMIEYFESTALSIELDGDYVTVYRGSWQSS